MRDVAVVGTAQSAHARRIDDRNEVEMLMPVLQELKDGLGVTQADLDFTCSGSTDYLAGQGFSFVGTLDGVGPYPPISESHVEADGAWALYEAWVKIQTGAADTALVYSYGKSSPGELPRVLSRQLDPYYYGPLWPDSLSLAALQTRALLDSGKATERDLAEIAVRSRAAAKDNPFATVSGDFDVDEILAEDHLVAPLRKHDCPPLSDGAVAVVLAADGRARELTENPAWIRGLEHRIDVHALGLRDLTDSPSTRLAARSGGRQRRPGRRRRAPRPLHRPGGHPPGGHRPERRRRRQPVGRGAGRQHDDGGRAGPHRRGGQPHLRGHGRSGRGPRHRRATACNRTSFVSWRRAEMGERVAVVGCGQTRHQATRGDVSIAGLVREAAMRALEDAGMTWADIDAVVVGKAPDFFEGLMMPELYLAEALGAVGKPMLRVHTAGSVGGSTAIVASSLVASGVHKRVLTVAFEKQSESEAMWALSLPVPFSQKLVAGAGGFFAPTSGPTCAGRGPRTTPGSWSP